MKMSQSYTNRISGHAFVLGGSGGIGREVVRALAANGASAITFTYGRNKEAAEKLAQDVAETWEGVKVHFIPLDVPRSDTDVEIFSRLLEQAVQAAGEEITVAVNTIGISPNQPYEEQTIGGRDGWLDVYQTNVFGSFITTREFAKRMKEKGVRGSITLITSTNGINSQAEFSVHYDSSKAAMAHMMRTLAEPLAREYGIRLNGIAPGWVDTPMNDTVPPDELAEEKRKTWLGRFAEPAEIAAIVAVVAGTAGSFIVGQNIIVDGGYR